MAADKTILQLQTASNLSVTDKGVIVQSGVTENYSLQVLVNLIAASVSLGSLITFGTTIPVGGKDTDVYLRTDSGQLFQRISSTWTVFYTFPSAVSGTSLRYGSGVPLNSLGINGDSYINTSTGIFYLRSAGIYSQVYSMATGPQGPQGTAGTNGTNGADGNTLLYGNGNPSNGLGVNGNFYLNTATYVLFGPKASGVWGSGAQLSSSYISEDPISIPAGSAYPFIIDFTPYAALIGINPTFIFKMVVSGGFRFINDCYCELIGTTLKVYGHSDDNTTTIDDLFLIIKQ